MNSTKTVFNRVLVDFKAKENPEAILIAGEGRRFGSETGIYFDFQEVDNAFFADQR